MRRDLAVEQHRAAILDRAAKTTDGTGAIEIMAHVFFTRPCELDRRALHLRGKERRVGSKVQLGPASETAAHQRRVDADVFLFDPGQFCAFLLLKNRVLITAPDIKCYAIMQRGRVHRLHRRMGKVGHAIFGGQFGRAFGQGFRIAVIPH